MLARPLVVPETLKKADVVVVLGGGAFINGSLGGASNERLIRGLLLYREGYAPKVIFAGGSIIKTSKKLVHTVLNAGDGAGVDVSEASEMMAIALKVGLPAGDLHSDPVSANTYENLVNAGAYMEEKGLGSCLLVTSPTHMRRALAVAGKLGLKCYPAPVVDYTPYRRGATDRLSLLREVLWEYAGLVLYRLYGYI